MYSVESTRLSQMDESAFLSRTRDNRFNFWRNHQINDKARRAKTAISHHKKGFRQGVTFPVVITNGTPGCRDNKLRDPRSPPRKREVPLSQKNVVA
ncbi:hypothetical protein F5Y04DRAFT_159808 [Hypomontagnella monticulosa]|nr:hypothetical protein F5Y04DRAFT_159808 [Hypomontagnella monticulosa]